MKPAQLHEFAASFRRYPRTSSEIDTMKTQVSFSFDPVISITFFALDSFINEVETAEVINDGESQQVAQFEVHIRGVATSSFRDYDCELYFVETDFDEACKKMNLYLPKTAWYVMGTLCCHQDRLTVYDASSQRIN